MACNKAGVDRNECKLHCTFSPSTLWFFTCITDIGAHKPWLLAPFAIHDFPIYYIPNVTKSIPYTYVCNVVSICTAWQSNLLIVIVIVIDPAFSQWQSPRRNPDGNSCSSVDLMMHERCPSEIFLGWSKNPSRTFYQVCPLLPCTTRHFCGTFNHHLFQSVCEGSRNVLKAPQFSNSHDCWTRVRLVIVGLAGPEILLGMKCHLIISKVNHPYLDRFTMCRDNSWN